MQRQQSSAQGCPSSRRSPCFHCQPCLCPGVQAREGLLSSEQPVGGGLGEREMKGLCLLPLSRLLSSAGDLHGLGGDVWKAQADEESLEGRAGGKLLPASRAWESRLAVPPHCCWKQTWRRQIFPLFLKKSEIPFCLHITFYFILLLLSSEAPARIRSPPVPGTAQPWGCRHPLPGSAALQDQTDPINISPAFQVGSCYIEGFQQELGNVSKVWLSSLLGLRSRIKLCLLLL